MTIASASNLTKCEEQASLLVQPLLPRDLMIDQMRYYAHSIPSLPQHFKISINNRRPIHGKGRNKDDKEPEFHLFDKLMGDVAIGTGVTFCVAPFLTVVDKAIVQRAAGSHSLWNSGLASMASIARNPIRYLKSPTFLWMWGVYAATYSTANSLKTYTEHLDTQERKTRRTRRLSVSSPNIAARSIDSGFAVFLGTSTVNSAGSLFKDRAYARMFGTVAKKNVPKISYGLWMSRDFLVVGSGFILPDLVAKHWGEEYKQVAQAGMPVAMQFIAGPLQLLGLDFYNRPLENLTTRQAILERSNFLKQGVVSVITARVARIIPGYSIGGVLNTKFRDQWRNYLANQENGSPLLSALETMRNKAPQLIST